MIVKISGDAEADVANGYWFYENQEVGLGAYFRACIRSDVQSLAIFGGIHEVGYGLHCMPAKRFPFAIYYKVEDQIVTVVAVLDARRDPGWIRDRLA